MLKTVLGKATGIIAICLVVLGTVIVPATPAEARYAGTADCDNNAIIRCGVSGEAETKQKYRSDAFVRTVYKHFSIPNEAALTGMVKGRVTKTNEVWVGNERLATGAVTTGRIRMGADEVKVPGAEAWMRPPSRSFRSNSLEALVKLNSRGEFQYAVLMSCGNPVQAAHKVKKPAPKPAPAPKPQPQPQPEPTPPPTEPKQPELEIAKDVQVLTSEGWGPFWTTDEVEANPGGEVSFRITVTNSGNVDLMNVAIKDILPSGVGFQPDTALDGSPGMRGKTVGDLVGDGIQIGVLPIGESVEVIFRVTISENTDACQTPLRNIATADSDMTPEVSDDAEVKVCQSEEQETPPQVQGVQTPPSGKLPETGAAVFGVFSMTSFLGFTTYKLKDFYLILLRK